MALVILGGAAAGIGVALVLLLVLPAGPTVPLPASPDAMPTDAGAPPRAEDSPDDEATAPAEGLDRVGLCEASVPHVNCRCFWQRLEPTFNEAELAAVAQALEVRGSLGAFAARARLAAEIGAERTRQVSRVLFDCTGPS